MENNTLSQESLDSDFGVQFELDEFGIEQYLLPLEDSLQEDFESHSN